MEWNQRKNSLKIVVNHFSGSCGMGRGERAKDGLAAESEFGLIGKVTSLL
jgi:hypothetical protein